MIRTCDQCGKHLVTQRADARFCSDFCRTQHKNKRRKQSSSDTRVNGASEAAVHPLADARAEQEATELKSHWSQVIYQGIVDRLKHGPVHADDLEPLFPANEQERTLCRKLVGAQFGSLASRRYIVEKERRKSSVPTRKGAKSGVFEFTQLGREKLVGHRAGGRGEPSQLATGAANATPSSVSGGTAGVTTGVASPQGTQSRSSHRSMGASSDPGDGSSVHGRQPTHGAGEPRPIAEVVSLFEEEHQPLSLVTDPEAA